MIGGVMPAPGAVAAVQPIVSQWVGIDGGADHAAALGVDLDAVIGDMDSISPAARARFRHILHPIAEQETTDFDKALRSIAAPLTIGIGLSGGRLDHELAVLSTLIAHCDRPCITVGEQSVTALCPPELVLDLPVGCDLSLFPMTTLGVRSAGLHWATEGVVFAPGGRIGTSNRTDQPTVVLRPDAPGMLVILPLAALGPLVAGMRAAPRWPAQDG